MKLRQYLIIGGFVLINVLIIKILIGNKNEEESTEKTEAYVPTLEAHQVKNVTKKYQISGYGEISSYNAVNLSSEVQGKLYKGAVDLKPGVKFSKGQLLFRIDDMEAQYTLRARKSTFINLIANLLPDIKIDFSSEYDKWNNYIQSIKLNKPLPELPVWKSDKEKIFLSTQSVLSEYFTIKNLDEQLKKYAVYAPFSGTITSVNVNEYSVVSPGTKVIAVSQTSNYEMAVSIPYSQIDKVKVNDKATIYTTSGTKKGEGKIIRISEVINNTTQSVDVYVKPVALDGFSFIEGEYLKVEVQSENEASGYTVPFLAVKESMVYLYQSDSTLTKSRVDIINETEEGYFISGLSDGDLIITQEVVSHNNQNKYKVLLKD